MDQMINDGAPAPADDNALFASVTGDTVPEPELAPVAEPPPPPAPEPAIPPGRLREEADARRSAERERDELRGRLAAMEQRSQPQQQDPDWFQNPDEALQHRLTPMQQAIANQRDQFSQMMAVEKFGEDKVQAAMKAITLEVESNPAARFEVQRMMSSPHPYGALVAWHSQRQTLAEIGNDPQAYRTRLQEDLLKDPAFLAKAVEASRGVARQTGNVVNRSPVSAAPSLPSLGRVGTAALPSDQEDVSDADLFNSTTRRARAG